MNVLIGEVAQQTGISARMLRHYDRIGLVSPSQRTSAGYRHYSDEDIERLFRVEGLRSLGLSLAEIPDALADERWAAGGMIDRLLDRARARLARADELVARLEHVQASDPAAWPDVMRTIGLMRGFDGGDASTRQRHALSLHDGDDRDVAVIVDAALREPDLNAAGAIVWAIARMGDAAVPPLADALDSSVIERRHRALRALEKIGTPAALAAVARQVDDADAFLRARAQLARGRSGDPSALASIVDLVVCGDDDVEATEVLERLAEPPGNSTLVVDALVAAAASADPPGRRRVVAALASFSGARAAAALRAFTDDDDRTVALTAKAMLQARQPQGEGDRREP
ncbi:MerR family transcriptional regulator [Microbacterium sp. PMB16]|uniref:MerR family transcriptional regulator n=1 Tax=Microbacterium sp. PMB16 TaxID=3120157 RepID=UPI003F4C65E1